MKLRKAIKKIVALGATTLLGATMIASAADLSEYPSPFIADGKFSGMLVVGDKAAAEDVIGVSDIAMSLQFAATTAAGTTSTTTSIEGDAWLVGTSSRKLEMVENSDTTNGESIQNISTSIDEDELDALADGSITTEKGTAGYNQYLNFEDVGLNGGYVKYIENDDDVAADFLYFGSGTEIARYSIEFKSSLQSDVEDSTGSKDTTGTYLGDMEDETISILGQDFNIVKARRVTSSGGGVELTLMGGSVKDTLNEGETKTINVDGKGVRKFLIIFMPILIAIFLSIFSYITGEKGMFVYAAPQCLYGRLDPLVYSPGRKLQEIGVVYLEEMLSTTALTKLGWILAHKSWRGSVATALKMKENLVGEFNDKLGNEFLV